MLAYNLGTGIILKQSQTKFYQIRFTKSKVSYVQTNSTKMQKNVKVVKIPWVKKRGNKGITNWSRFQGLQIEARGITNRGILGDLKSVRKDYKQGQGFQIWANRFQTGVETINRSKRDYKPGAGITNQCIKDQHEPDNNLHISVDTRCKLE